MLNKIYIFFKRKYNVFIGKGNRRSNPFDKDIYNASIIGYITSDVELVTIIANQKIVKITFKTKNKNNDLRDVCKDIHFSKDVAIKASKELKKGDLIKIKGTIRTLYKKDWSFRKEDYSYFEVDSFKKIRGKINE